MYFKIEYYRIIHYFYFYLGTNGIILAAAAYEEYQITSIVLTAAALINLYKSYCFEKKIHELITETKTAKMLSHALIILLATAYSCIFIINNLLSEFLQSMLIITVYASIFTTIILIMARLGLTHKASSLLGITREQIGAKKVQYLACKKHYLFKEIFSIVDIKTLSSYRIGTENSIDRILRDIESTETLTNLSYDIKFLFIALYEKKLENARKKSNLEKTITQLKKQL